jgi:hypothetical protein
VDLFLVISAKDNHLVTIYTSSLHIACHEDPWFKTLAPDIVINMPPKVKDSTLLAGTIANELAPFAGAADVAALAGDIEPFSEFMSAAQERTWLLYVVGKSRFLTQEKRTAEQQNLA